MKIQDPRVGYIADTIAALVKEAVLEKIPAVEAAAAATAEDSEDEEGDEKPITAKLAVKISWPAGQPVPEVEVTASYSVRRSITLSAEADGHQAKLGLESSNN